MDNYTDIDELFGGSNIEDLNNESENQTEPTQENNEADVEGSIVDLTEIEERDTTEQEVEDNTLEVMFNFLREKEALRLPQDYVFDGSEEAFENAIKYSKQLDEQNLFTELLNSLPEDYKDSIIFGLQSGKPLKEFIEYTSDVELDSLNLNNESDQIKLLNKYYTKVANFSPERSQKLISNLQKSGELYSAAQEYFEEIKALDQARAQELVIQAQEEREALARRAAQTRQVISQAIDSDTLPDTRKQQLKAFMFNEVASGKEVGTMYNKVLAQIQNNPSHLAQLANILMEYSPDKGIVLDRFTQQTKSNTIKGIKQQLLDAKSNTKANVKGTSSAPEKRSFDWDAYLAGLG